MKPHIIIEIRNGMLAAIHSNTQDIIIHAIDYDARPIEFNQYEPDSIMTEQGLADYMAKEMEAEEIRLQEMSELEQGHEQPTHYLFQDLTGHRPGSTTLRAEQIRENWNLEEVDEDDMSLLYFLDNCDSGTVWETNDKRLTAL